jgi:hypothetical protein
MRISRVTIILLLILAFGAIFTWYWEFSPAKDARLTPTPTSMPKVVGSWSADEIVALDITLSKDNPIRLRRNSDSSWAFGTLEGKQPDQGKVLQFLTSLTTLAVTNSINSGISLDEIGLTNPTFIIQIKNRDNEIEIIKVGNSTPTQNGYYLQVNEELPVVTNKYSVDSMIELIQGDNLTLQTPTPIN